MYEIFEKLCDLKGITPYKFCKDTGVNSSTISTWKKNNSQCRPELAEKVCTYFGVSHDYLMTGKEKEGGETYYLNDETKEIAQAIFENKELKMLFDVSRNAPADRLIAYYNLIKAMQDTEKGND